MALTSAAAGILSAAAGFFSAGAGAGVCPEVIGTWIRSEKTTVRIAAANGLHRGLPPCGGIDARKADSLSQRAGYHPSYRGRASGLTPGRHVVKECGTGSTRRTRRLIPEGGCAPQGVAGLGPRRPRRASIEEKKMRTRSLLVLALSGLLVAGGLPRRRPPTRTRSSSSWTPWAPRSWTRSWIPARRTRTTRRPSGTRWSASTSRTAGSAPVSPSAGSSRPTARAGPSISARISDSTTATRSLPTT